MSVKNNKMNITYTRIQFVIYVTLRAELEVPFCFGFYLAACSCSSKPKQKAVK